MIRGRDYSVVQSGGHPIDWAAEAGSGVRFAYLRCGVVNDGPDIDFARNATGAIAAGIAVGPYEFYYDIAVGDNPSRAPEAQADALVKAATVDGVLIGSLAGHLPPADDLEWPVESDRPKWGITSSVDARNHALASLQAIRARFNRRPLAYTYPNYAAGIQLAGDLRFLDYPLWLASYALTPQPIKPWAGWTVWQTSGGTVEFCKLLNGNRVPVDGDVIADEASFAQLLAVTS